TAQVGQGIWGPIVIFAFFVVSMLVCRLLLQPIVPLIVNREKAEGDFRYLHVRLRENAESITLMRGEEIERKNLDFTFDTLLNIQWKILLFEIPLKCVTVLIDYAGALVCYFIVAVPILSGAYDNYEPVEIAALISKSFSDIAGYTTRISEFLEALDELQTNNEQQKMLQTSHIVDEISDTTPLLQTSTSSSNVAIQDYLKTSDSESLVVSNISFQSPNGLLLGSKVSFNLLHPKNMIIQGPSGCGKTALLRVLAGLWQPLSGTCWLPLASKRRHSVLFLPQMTYMLASTSLRQQIAYPDQIENVEFPEMMLDSILDSLGISYLMEREKKILEDTSVVGSSINSLWIEELSPGEKQRIAFARVLFHKPLFALLDEPASALEAATEKEFILLAKESGISCVLVSHHNISEIGDGVFDLQLINEGGPEKWTVRSLDKK
ncbi:ATP-binding cassette sub- D member 4, partial [Nowakowskiella sp. JEL0078]